MEGYLELELETASAFDVPLFICDWAAQHSKADHNFSLPFLKRSHGQGAMEGWLAGMLLRQ